MTDLITSDQRQAFYNAFHRFYKGNESAISLSMMLIDSLHVWDDLIDGDEVSSDNVNRVFRYLIYDIPLNPVYRLIPGMPDHLLNVYLRWRDATEMEAEEKPDLEKTYMLRAGLYDIFSLIAYHLCGDDWSQKIGPDIRKLYGETLDDLKGEFNA
jgi:hypothetical protein